MPWLFMSTLFARHRQLLYCLLLPILTACSALQYQPIRTLAKADPSSGYRLETAIAAKQRHNGDDTLVVLMFSGGGTRAAAFGYGVLEALQQQQVYLGGKRTRLLNEVDVVYGISGGSVLAAYYGLHGEATIPAFERQFLHHNLQKILARQLLSVTNWPRLTSPQFGRGDLLQEQLDLHLFKGATYADLLHRRRGPFVVISATDMSLGQRVDFTQNFFDVLCVDLTDLPLSRAVAASSAVPLVFAPVTLNNHGGQCDYQLPPDLAATDMASEDFYSRMRQSHIQRIIQYQNSRRRPYIHLLDGGLTDNLGLRSMLDATDIFNRNTLNQNLAQNRIRKMILINVNAQTQMGQEIDQSADVPGFSAVLNAVVNIPIDKYSQDTLRQFNQFVDDWNRNKTPGEPDMYFVSINLLDLPPGELRDSVIRIPTTFYLPRHDVQNLRTAAAKLLSESAEYRRLVQDLSSQPIEADGTVAKPDSNDGGNAAAASAPPATQ